MVARTAQVEKLTTGEKMTLTICTIGMWGTQTLLHKFLQKSSVRTMNPAEADYFFVPAYPKCTSDREKLTAEEMNSLYIDLVQVTSLHPGRDLDAKIQVAPCSKPM